MGAGALPGGVCAWGVQEAQSTPGAPAASTFGKRRHLLGLAWLLPVLLPSAAVSCWRLQGAAPSEARGRHPNTGLRSTSSMSPRAAALRCVRPHACRSDAQPCGLSPWTSTVAPSQEALQNHRGCRSHLPQTGPRGTAQLLGSRSPSGSHLLPLVW